MKLILLQHLSGAQLRSIGDEIEVDDRSAFRFIKKGIAKAKTAKAHNDLMAKIEKLNKEEADKEAKLVAIQKRDELKAAADALIEELLPIVSALESIDRGYGEALLERIALKVSAPKKRKPKDEA